MIALIHVAFWRIPFFWMDVCDTISSDGAILCCISGDKTRPLDSGCESGHRERIFYHFLNAVFEIFSLPMILLVFITGYRVPSLVATFRDSTKTAVDKKVKLVYHFINIPLDALFLIAALCTAMMLVRLKYMIHDFYEEWNRDRDVWGRRGVVLYHFVLSFRDVLCLIPLAVVLLSIYRGFFAIKQISNKVSRWAPTAPLISVTEASLTAAPARTTGLLLRVKGTKPDDFSLPANARCGFTFETRTPSGTA
jgi:hypothetical protein